MIQNNVLNTQVILGIGSNLGDRTAALQQALSGVSRFVRVSHVSQVYEAAAHMPPSAPQDWNLPYLNAVLVGETNLSPLRLLAELKLLEHSLGRQEREVWAPREIDIDILTFGAGVIHLPELVVPHRHMLNRDFVMLPIADILPDWVFPGPGPMGGKTAKEIVSTQNFKEHVGLTRTYITLSL